MLTVIPWYYKALAGVALIAALIAGYAGFVAHERNIGREEGRAETTAKYDEMIRKQKDEAAKVIATETANVAATEKKLRETKDQQEITDATNNKKINNLSNRVRLLSGALGRLRDPHAGRGEGSGGAQNTIITSAGTGPDNGAEAGGLLSAELTGFLQRKTREADEINRAYTSCRADSFSVRKLMQDRK